MRADVARLLVAADLGRRGWVVYQHHVGGSGAPALLIGSAASAVHLRVAVGAAIVRGPGRIHANWSRGESADLLALVDEGGTIHYRDSLRREVDPVPTEQTPSADLRAQWDDPGVPPRIAQDGVLAPVAARAGAV